jgi:hypothetical protein
MGHPRTHHILDPTSQLKFQHLSQNIDMYPLADDYWREATSVEEEEEEEEL